MFLHREEKIKFMRPNVIPHLIRTGQTLPEMLQADVCVVDFNVNRYYETQRPLNRFELPKSQMPYPYKAAYGCAMPLINKEAGY
jgi:hypothetical protein